MITILKRPVITEKALTLARSGFFTFAVDRQASKKMIAKAVKDEFGVDVISVATMLVKGKSRRVGRTRREVATQQLKKAIVKLKKDQKIALFDVGQ